MTKTLTECQEQYNFYSGKCCDAITNHESDQVAFYLEKLQILVEYALYNYNVDLNSGDYSEIL